MLKYLTLAVCLIIECVCLTCEAQVQLVLLKRERVILRLNPGDEFVYRLKGSEEIRHTYIDNVYDTAVLTGKNVIVPIYQIDRVYFQRTRFYNKVGWRFIGAGVMLFLADQVNSSVLQNEDFRIDKGITTVSFVFVGTGLPMALIKKKSQRIRHKYRLIRAGQRSVFYRE